jgi:membrane fusion protein
MRGHHLFRKEVFEQRYNDGVGTLSVRPPKLGWLFFAVAFCIVIASVSLLLFGRYTRYEEIHGSLVPDKGALEVVASVPGVVHRVLLQEGDFVQAGEGLLEIYSGKTSVAMGDTDAEIRFQLNFVKQRLQSNLLRVRSYSEVQRKSLEGQLRLLRQRIEKSQEQIDLEQQRERAADQLYQQWAGLKVTGVVSKLQLLQQRDVSLQDKAHVKELIGENIALKNQAQDLQTQLETLPIATADKVDDIERQLADISQKLSQNAEDHGIVLRAPVNGVITNILAHPGQAVNSTQLLITILPSDSKLVAELWASSKSIGLIHRGNSVKIKLSAFPYRTFGQQDGTVQFVSQSAIANTEDGAGLQHQSDSQFRILVTLKKQYIEASDSRVPLRSGMALDADIVIGRRPLIEWFINSPLHAVEERK